MRIEIKPEIKEIIDKEDGFGLELDCLIVKTHKIQEAFEVLNKEIQELKHAELRGSSRFNETVLNNTKDASDGVSSYLYKLERELELLLTAFYQEKIIKKC